MLSNNYVVKLKKMEMFVYTEFVVVRYFKS